MRKPPPFSLANRPRAVDGNVGTAAPTAQLVGHGREHFFAGAGAGFTEQKNRRVAELGVVDLFYRRHQFSAGADDAVGGTELLQTFVVAIETGGFDVTLGALLNQQ